MAYGDYGAVVTCNGIIRDDKSHCTLFDQPLNLKDNWFCHGVMGDGNIRVKCYKQGLPEIYELLADGTKTEIQYDPECKLDQFDYEPVKFEYNGYKFYFESGTPYYARMEEPDGTVWVCEYDYGYGDDGYEGFSL